MKKSMLLLALAACSGQSFDYANTTTVADGGFSLDATPSAGFDAGLVLQPKPKLNPEVDSSWVDSSPDAEPDVADPPGDAPDADPLIDADTPDACRPSWYCHGFHIDSRALCAIYESTDGGPPFIEAQTPPDGCPLCGTTCACLTDKVVCGSVGAGPVTHPASCMESVTGQIEVTCR